MGLSWDEAVYVSQVSGHAPAAWFDPARARGVPLLVAPVAALTSSVTALRVYLSVACGLGLTVALWTWRRLRPAWVLGLAGVLFGGLWVAQYYGPQAMPDMWSALGGLAAVGCFLRGGRRRWLGLGFLGRAGRERRVRDPGPAGGRRVPGCAAGRRGDPDLAELAAGRRGRRWPGGGRRRVGRRGVRALRRHRQPAARGRRRAGRVRSALRAARRAASAERADAVPPVHRRRPVSRTGPVVVPAAGAGRAGRPGRAPGRRPGPEQRAAARRVRSVRRRAVPVHDQLRGAAVPAARLRAARRAGRRRARLPRHRAGPGAAAGHDRGRDVLPRRPAPGPAPRPRSRGGRDRNVPRRLHADRHRAGRPTASGRRA